MKSLIFVVSLALVAIQLTRAAPAPGDEKKEAVVAAVPSAVVDAVPRAAEVQADVGVTHGLEDASTWILREMSKGSAVDAKTQ